MSSNSTVNRLQISVLSSKIGLLVAIGQLSDHPLPKLHTDTNSKAFGRTTFPSIGAHQKQCSGYNKSLDQ